MANSQKVDSPGDSSTRGSVGESVEDLASWKERVVRLMRDGAWEEVADASETLRQKLPEDALGYIASVRALRQLGRHEQADSAAAEGLERLPDDLQLMIETCRNASAALDWQRLVERSGRIIDRFPSEPMGYTLRIQALRYQGRFAEGEQVLASVIERFPNDIWLGMEACWLALRPGEWEPALERSSRFREAHPTLEFGYRIALSALRSLNRFDQAEGLLTTAARNLEGEWASEELLKLRKDRGDPHGAIELATRLIESEPTRASAYCTGAWALRRLGRLDEAEQLLLRAMERLPQDVRMLSEFAAVAQDRGDWKSAEQRWAQARRAFPDDSSIALAHALLPTRGGLKFGASEVRESHERFDAMHSDFPSLGSAYAKHIRMFRQANRPQEADEIARTACAKRPDDVEIRLEYSQVAAEQGRPEDALGRLVEVRDRFSGDVWFQTRLVAALAAARKSDEAEALCMAVMAAHPGTVIPLIEYAELAMTRHDWGLGAERWLSAARRFPDHPFIRQRLSEARLALGAAVGEEEPGLATSSLLAHPVSAAREESSIEPIVAQFESLGGTALGCEFGLVQRHFGCEPLGLLRWGSIDTDNLASALESHFEGMGSPEQSELSVLDGEMGGPNEHLAEYRVVDRRYDMTMHTNIRVDQMPFDKMYTQTLRRIVFLKRKLLEDLQEAQKLFVYKRGHADVGAGALRLAKAIRAHSPRNLLLCVRLSSATRAAGTIEQVSDNLVFGYVSHFTVTPSGDARRPAYAEWESICRKTRAIRAALGGGPESGA